MRHAQRASRLTEPAGAKAASETVILSCCATGAGNYLVEGSTDFLVVGATTYLDRSTNQSMTYGSPNSDLQHFLRSWLSDPLRVSAVAPSGDALARLMTREISPCDGPILELGPGTGVFTKALLDRGVSESELTLIENGPDFARLLRHRFPQSRVLLADAARLARLDLFPVASVGAVVSGLPLLSMSPRQVLSVLRGTFGYLRPDGTFYQFTYGFRCPVPRPILDRLRLKATRVGQTVRNLPPAAVYRITRRPSN